jgi:hypothetical protein
MRGRVRVASGGERRSRLPLGGSIEILKNRIAEAVFERSFSQRPGKD